MQQTHRAQNHSRRTPAALHRVVFKESLLHRMQLAALGEPFNSHDALARHAADLREARFHRLPVHQHRAGRALPLAAAKLGSGEIEIVAQNAE